MPKRTAEEKIQHYHRKILKLQRKRTRLSSSSSDADSTICTEVTMALPDVEEPDILQLQEPTILQLQESEDQSNISQHDETQSTQEVVVVPSLEVADVLPQETVDLPNPNVETVPDLDPSILAALGEITDDSPDFGEKIHDSLAKIFIPILKKGIIKENKEKLLKEYLIPENCQLLKAPTLNPEILAAIAETGRYRDKKMAVAQQQLGIGITAVSRGLNLLLTKDNKVEAIKFISDGCRILCDLHLQNTETRKRFITPNLEKSFLQLIQAERDETLFGNKLSENIKASKAIVQQSQQIKKNIPSHPKPSTSQSSTWVNHPGNRQAPPRYQSNRGGRGGTKRPTQRSVIPPPAPLLPQPRYNQNKVRGTTRQQHP